MLSLVPALTAICSMRPSNCRANDYDRKTLYRRYLGVLQDLYVTPRIKEALQTLAEADPAISYIKGHLKARPGDVT